MRFWQSKIIKFQDVKGTAKAGVLAMVIGIAGGSPLTALATTPPSGAFEVGSTNSGFCMEASGWVSGSSVTLDNCNNQINQKWYVNRAGYYNGQIAYDIETAKAGSFQCLNDINHSVASGAPVNLVQCNGVNSGDRFVMVNGNELFNIASGECLDSTISGAQLMLNPCDASASSQMWFRVPNSAKP